MPSEQTECIQLLFTPIYPAAPLCRGAGFAFFKGNVSGRKDSSPDAVKTGGQACMIK